VVMTHILARIKNIPNSPNDTMLMRTAVQEMNNIGISNVFLAKLELPLQGMVQYDSQ